LISIHGFRFYHETQSLSLCAQHAINNLLQKPVFNQQELNFIADGLYSSELQLHDARQSIFCDQDGNFSIDVIEEALLPYNITLQRLRNHILSTSTAEAYIIQRVDHWFTIRKAGDQWFNLNSTQPRPTLIPNFNLQTFVNQLAGTPNVFAVIGPIPAIRGINNSEGKK
jgi:ataxin-3